MSLGCASPSSCLRPLYRLGHNCRSALPGLLRDAMWALAPWHSQALAAWIEEIQPDVLLFAPGESVFSHRGRLPACQRLRTSGWWPFVTTASTPLRRLPSPAAPLPPAPSLGPAASGRQHLPAHCQPAHVRGLRPPIFHPLPGALHTPSAPTPGPYRACGHPVLWQSGVGTLAAAGCHRAGSAHSGASRVPRGGGLLPRGKPPYFVPFHQGKRPPVLRQHPPAAT